MKFRVHFSDIAVLLFAIYNFIYAFYMAGFLRQQAYLTAVLVFILAVLTYIVILNRGKIRFRRLNFWNETSRVLQIAAAFLAITLLVQLKNRNFEAFFVIRLLYLVLPAVLVFCIANTAQENYKIYVYIYLARMFLQFFLINSGDLSLSNILNISWSDTNSSLFESTQAHEFFIMTILLLYMNKKFLAVSSTIGCLLCFKRVSFLLCLVTWFLLPCLREKSVPKWVVRLCGIGMILSPYILLWLYTGNGSQWFGNVFGVSLDSFTTSRMTLIKNTMLLLDGHYNGYGTIRNFFYNYSEWYRHLSTMHCDMLSLYLECTIVGVIVYICNLLQIAKKNAIIFYGFGYAFVELLVSHFIESVSAWTLLFLLSFMMEKKVCDSHIESRMNGENTYEDGNWHYYRIQQ